MSETLRTGLIVVAIVAILICAPLATIWALNTLFALAIPYTFKTWAAAVVLGFVIGGSSKASR